MLPNKKQPSKVSVDMVVTELWHRMMAAERGLAEAGLDACCVCEEWFVPKRLHKLTNELVCVNCIEAYLQRQGEESLALPTIAKQLARLGVRKHLCRHPAWNRWLGYLPSLQNEFEREREILP